MADKKELVPQDSEWNVKQVANQFKHSFYEPRLDEFVADPKNTADMPAELLVKYELQSILPKDSSDKRLWVVERRSDGVMGFCKYIRERDPNVINRARREMELLAELSHPAIPKVMDYWDCEKGACLVRQHFEGTSLDIELGKRHKNGRGYFSAAEVFELALRIGEVLAYLGDQNLPVVHRDIKPQNIILTPDGEYKLVDFDVARRYDPTKLRDTTLGKSEGFAAPEQYGYRQTDPSADRYGLGATLLYMTTGTFDIESGLSKVADTGLKYIIQKCCAFAPAERFSSVDGMMRGIGYLQEGFVPLGEQAKVLGTTLESYKGNNKKLWLQGISHIKKNAFEHNACDSIEEIVLSSLFASDSISELSTLKNLSRIEIEDGHPKYSSSDGVLYEAGWSDGDRIKIFPPKKAGTWIVPTFADSNFYTSVQYSSLSSDLVEEIVIEDGHKRIRSVDGIVYSKAEEIGKLCLELCPRAKKGTVQIPDNVIYIHPYAFYNCAKLTQVVFSPNFKVHHKENLRPFCRLFEGCDGLAAEFQHDWMDYGELSPSGLQQAKCAKCGEVRGIGHWNPPDFGTGTLSICNAMAMPEVESVGSQPEGSLWKLSGKTIKSISLPYSIGEYNRAYDDVIYRIDPNIQLYQIEWAADEEIHKGVTKGTVGGWIQQGAHLGAAAWVDADAVVFSGAKVYGRARISGKSWICSGAYVYDYAVVDGVAQINSGSMIYNHAHITSATISGHRDIHRKSNNHEAHIYGRAIVDGYASIAASEYGDIRISGNTRIYGNPRISGNVSIIDNAQFTGSPRITSELFHYGEYNDKPIRISGNVHIEGDVNVSGSVAIREDARIYGNANVSGNIIICNNAQIGGNAVLTAKGYRKKLVSVNHNMTDNDWDDFNEDNDWRWNYPHSDIEMHKKSNKIKVGGNMKIIGDAIIDGNAVFDDDRLISSGTYFEQANFTRMVFDEEHGEWTNSFIPSSLPESVTYRLEFFVPDIGDGDDISISITESLASYLSFVASPEIKPGHWHEPYPPKVYLNGQTICLNEPRDYEVIYSENGAGNEFYVEINHPHIKIQPGGQVSVFYKTALRHSAGVLGPSKIESTAKLVVNGIEIIPT